MIAQIDLSDINRAVSVVAKIFSDKTVVDCLHDSVKKTMVPQARRNIRANTTVFSGSLLHSIRVEKDQTKGGFFSKGERAVTFGSFGVKHAAAIEEGGRPHTPPWDPIYKWVVGKVRPSDPYAFTKAVIRTIEARGTKKYPFVKPAVYTQADPMAKEFMICLLRHLTRRARR